MAVAATAAAERAMVAAATASVAEAEAGAHVVAAAAVAASQWARLVARLVVEARAGVMMEMVVVMRAMEAGARATEGVEMAAAVARTVTAAMGKVMAAEATVAGRAREAEAMGSVAEPTAVAQPAVAVVAVVAATMVEAAKATVPTAHERAVAAKGRVAASQEASSAVAQLAGPEVAVWRAGTEVGVTAADVEKAAMEAAASVARRGAVSLAMVTEAVVEAPRVGGWAVRAEANRSTRDSHGMPRRSCTQRSNPLDPHRRRRNRMVARVAVQAAAVSGKVGVVVATGAVPTAVVAMAVAVVEAAARVGAGRVVDEQVMAVAEMEAVVVSTAAAHSAATMDSGTRGVAVPVRLKAAGVMVAEEMVQAAGATGLEGSVGADTVGAAAAGLLVVAEPAVVRWVVGAKVVGCVVAARREVRVAGLAVLCTLESTVAPSAAVVQAVEGRVLVMPAEALSAVELLAAA